MATIKEYFANAKLTPDDKGTSAFNEAARRVAASYEQIARGTQESGELLSKLWSEYKFGPDSTLEKGGGGGFRVKGGLGPNPFTLGGPMSGATPATPDYLQRVGRQYNARGANEISNAAPNLARLTTALIQGQGLTDTQYQQLGMTKRGTQLLNPGGGIDYKDGVKPNPEPTYEDAEKAGFHMGDDPNAPFGRTVPSYPISLGGVGLPDILPPDPELAKRIAADNPGTWSDPAELAKIQAGTPSKKDTTATFTDLSDQTPGVMDSSIGQAVGSAAYTGAYNMLTLGGTIPWAGAPMPPPGGTVWSAVQQAFTPTGVPAELNQDTGGAPQTDQTFGMNDPNNPVQ